MNPIFEINPPKVLEEQTKLELALAESDQEWIIKKMLNNPNELKIIKKHI